MFNVTYDVNLLSHTNLSSEIHIQSLPNINYTLTNMLINKVLMNVPELPNICFQGNNKKLKKHNNTFAYTMFSKTKVYYSLYPPLATLLTTKLKSLYFPGTFNRYREHNYAG